MRTRVMSSGANAGVVSTDLDGAGTAKNRKRGHPSKEAVRDGGNPPSCNDDAGAADPAVDPGAEGSAGTGAEGSAGNPRKKKKVRTKRGTKPRRRHSNDGEDGATPPGGARDPAVEPGAEGSAGRGAEGSAGNPAKKKKVRTSKGPKPGRRNSNDGEDGATPPGGASGGAAAETRDSKSRVPRPRTRYGIENDHYLENAQGDIVSVADHWVNKHLDADAALKTTLPDTRPPPTQPPRPPPRQAQPAQPPPGPRYPWDEIRAATRRDAARSRSHTTRSASQPPPPTQEQQPPPQEPSPTQEPPPRHSAGSPPMPAQSSGSVGQSIPRNFRFRLYAARRDGRLVSPDDYHRIADVGDPVRLLDHLQAATGLSFNPYGERYEQFKALWGLTPKHQTPFLRQGDTPEVCPECHFPMGGIKLLVYCEPDGEAPLSTKGQRFGRGHSSNT